MFDTIFIVVMVTMIVLLVQDSRIKKELRMAPNQKRHRAIIFILKAYEARGASQVEMLLETLKLSEQPDRVSIKLAELGVQWHGNRLVKIQHRLRLVVSE